MEQEVLCSCPLSPEATTMSTQEATSSNSATRDQSHSAATQTGASKGKTIKHKNVKFSLVFLTIRAGVGLSNRLGPIEAWLWQMICVVSDLEPVCVCVWEGLNGSIIRSDYANNHCRIKIKKKVFSESRWSVWTAKRSRCLLLGFGEGLLCA